MSGDFDGVMYGWDFDEFSAADDGDEDEERNSKRQKTEPKRVGDLLGDTVCSDSMVGVDFWMG